jgi:hypothetical protein
LPRFAPSDLIDELRAAASRILDDFDAEKHRSIFVTGTEQV